ncbi:MAG: DUF4295 domain-containing protein [Bacteroidales bacterium]|jgi:hypothetical protein
MAKKAVATLRELGNKTYVKVIKMVKSEKTGAYTFDEKIVTQEQVKDFFEKK